MDQHRERAPGPAPITLWAFPFRPFFLSSALVAALLVPLWLWVWRHGQSTLALPPLLWHQHEMLAGFLNAAVAGFLLTAVCNWTGTAPLAGWRLAALWLVWLAGRLAMALAGDAAPWAVALDLLFVPLVMLDAGVRIWRARQRRQMIVLLVLLAFWGLDAAFHWRGDPRYLHALVLLGALLILVIGGRITPAFTSNWLRQQGENPALVTVRPWLDRGALITVAVLVCLRVAGLTSSPWQAALALLAALLVLARLVGWAGWRTGREPLLWILHLGHLWVVAGLVLLGLAALSLVPGSAWLHALGAGAMGTMVLGVMTRVAVGHTGRPLRLRRGGLTAYLLMLCAGLARVAVALGVMPMMAGLWLAALAWSGAWLVFLGGYGRILLTRRADGRPG
ncbi:NnrS family protein [Alcanivorax sp. ZXX171]|nr:NnrS family protein [Alcanivorax sp. ZXX171]